ncbi:MAG: hypothetical protein ACK4UO_09440 [Pseudolabrys sp.]
MADKNALGAIGLMLGAATMLVMVIGSVVISDHLNGNLQLDEGVRVVALPAVTR